MPARKAKSTDKPKANGKSDPKPLMREDTLAKLQQLAKIRGVSIDELIRRLIAGEPNSPTPKKSNFISLTPKQAMVLAHLKSGLSVKETAKKMDISEETVRIHILRARNRLDCLSLAGMPDPSHQALEHGYLRHSGDYFT